MLEKLTGFLDSIWNNILGRPTSSTEYLSQKRPNSAIGDAESDEIMVLEEPASKRMKTYSRNTTAVKCLWTNVKNFSTNSSHEASNVPAKCDPEVGFLPRTSDPFDSLLSNKENMSSQRQTNHKRIFESSINVHHTQKESLGPSNPCSPDPNFRFSPSCTSTASRNHSFKRRDSPKSSHHLNLEPDPLLQRLKNNSAFKKRSSPLAKKFSIPFSKKLHYSNLKKSLLNTATNTAQDSYRINEKIQYKNLIESYGGIHLSSSLSILRKNAPSSNTLTESAFKGGALKLKECGTSLNNQKSSTPELTKEQSESLQTIKNLLSAPTGPEVIDLASKDSSSESTIKISSQSSISSKREDSQSSEEIVITKEIVKSPENRIQTLNPIEMKISKSKFFSESSRKNHLSKENKLRLEEHMVDLARRTKERNERVRKESSNSKDDEVTNRLSNLKLSFPAIVKEITLEEEEEALPELTPEIESIIAKAFRGGPINQVLADKFNIQITRKDLHTLSGLNWLNDEVINFFMNLIVERNSKNTKLPKVYAFNTFFYPKLIKMGYSSIKRWTKKVDIFAHDVLLVPVHLGVHWCLSTIDIRDKTVRYFDSMSGDNHKCVEELLRYLEQEHMDKKKSAYNTSGWKTQIMKKIPQQMNGSDCGMFSCMFAEYISRNAKITFSQDDMPYFRKKMVYEIVTQKLMI